MEVSMENVCANCRIELPHSDYTMASNLEPSSNCCTERLSEFISYHEGYEVKVTIKDALLTIFEQALQLNHIMLPQTKSISMCSQCTAVLAELYRFYVEFMKLSREASYITEIIQESVLWEFSAVDNKKHVQQRLQELQQQQISVISGLPIVPKVLLDVQEEGEDDQSTGTYKKQEIRKRQRSTTTSAAAAKKKKKKVGRPRSTLKVKTEQDDTRHQQEKFPCTICSKEFGRKADLTRHLKTVHYAEGLAAVAPGEDNLDVDPDEGNYADVYEADAGELDDASDEDYVPTSKIPNNGRSPAEPSTTELTSTDEQSSKPMPLGCETGGAIEAKAAAEGNLTTSVAGGEGKAKEEQPAADRKPLLPVELKFDLFKCDKCTKTFRRKDYLKAHERCHMSAEDKQRELQQRQALERLHKRSKARKPMINKSKTKHQQQPLKTPSSSSSSSSTFNNQQSDYSMPANRKRRCKGGVNAAAYHCTECTETFATRETMKYHRRKVHPKATFPCTVNINCKRIFHSENDLKIHENVKHGIGEKLLDRICPVPDCGKYFALPNIMKRHVQSVHCEDKDRIYQCPFCPLKFPIKNRLDTHLKNRHNSDNSLQSLKCEHCERVYETKSGLSQHIETVHTNLRVFSCDICNRTSIRPEWLKKHLELHDESREKKFICPQCGMKFFRNASLKKHLKNHSGAKNYLCSECGDKFRQTSSLRRHIEAKHSMKNGPFTCDQCGKSFKIKEYLAQHLRAKSHGGRGHGLYTPAGKRRLEREREQQRLRELQLQSQQNLQIQGEGGQVLGVDDVQQQIKGQGELQQQHEQQFHLLTDEEAAAVNAAQLVDVKIHEIQIPILIDQAAAFPKQESSIIIHHMAVPQSTPSHTPIPTPEPRPTTTTTAGVNIPNLTLAELSSSQPNTPSSYSSAAASPSPSPSQQSQASMQIQMPATFQGQPIQFLTSINPAWFQQASSGAGIVTVAPGQSQIQPTPVTTSTGTGTTTVVRQIQPLGQLLNVSRTNAGSIIVTSSPSRSQGQQLPPTTQQQQQQQQFF